MQTHKHNTRQNKTTRSANSFRPAFTGKSMTAFILSGDCASGNSSAAASQEVASVWCRADTLSKMSIKYSFTASSSPDSANSEHNRKQDAVTNARGVRVS